MNKLILSSITGLLLVAGIGFILSATEPVTKATKSCCTSTAAAANETKSGCTGTANVQTTSLGAGSGCTGHTATVEKTGNCTGQTAAEKTCCKSDTQSTQANPGNDVQFIQTSNVAGSNSTNTTQSVATGCTGSGKVKAGNAAAGECTKVPSGISGQRANRNN